MRAWGSFCLLVAGRRQVPWSWGDAICEWMSAYVTTSPNLDGRNSMAGVDSFHWLDLNALNSFLSSPLASQDSNHTVIAIFSCAFRVKSFIMLSLAGIWARRFTNLKIPQNLTHDATESVAWRSFVWSPSAQVFTSFGTASISQSQAGLKRKENEKLLRITVHWSTYARLLLGAQAVATCWIHYLSEENIRSNSGVRVGRKTVKATSKNTLVSRWWSSRSSL